MKKLKRLKKLVNKNRKALLIITLVLVIILSGGVYAALNTHRKTGLSNQNQNKPTNTTITTPPASSSTEQTQQPSTTSPTQELTCNVDEQNSILAQLSEQMKTASAYFFSKWDAYTQTKHTADELTFYARGISTAAYNMASSARDEANKKLASINCPLAPSIESYKIFARP